jgi:hypothetical protein
LFSVLGEALIVGWRLAGCLYTNERFGVVPEKLRFTEDLDAALAGSEGPLSTAALARSDLDAAAIEPA